MSYHLINIHKHSHNSPLKLLEESYEFIDSLAQGNKIMAAVELSDLIGAIKLQAEKLNLSIDDLLAMSNATERAFNSSRPNFNFIDYLYNNHYDIKEFGLGFIQVKLDNFNYNFYTDIIKKFDTYEEPHNHQQNFISEIIQGQLTENLYFLNNGSETLSCVCGNPDVKLPNVSYSYDKTLIHNAGSLYYRGRDTYHSVKALKNTITKVMKMGDKQDAFAFGDNSQYEDYMKIHKHLKKEQLWEIIREMI